MSAHSQMTPDVINEYVDGALDPSQRAAVEAHLSTCAECRALADDLRQIVKGASTLPALTPDPLLWARVAEHVRKASQPIPRRLWRAAIPLAAAAVLILLVVARQQLWQTPSERTIVPAKAQSTTPAGSESNAKLVQSVESELRLAEEHYEKAIAGLEAITSAGQKTLDPKLAATLQKNLAVIDQAIGESRAALRAQPDSRPAQESLFEAFRSKVALLQNTVSLVNEMRKGNQAEAARIVGQLAR